MQESNKIKINLMLIIYDKKSYALVERPWFIWEVMFWSDGIKLFWDSLAKQISRCKKFYHSKWKNGGIPELQTKASVMELSRHINNRKT
jgi:hypothetical protein